MGLRNDLVTRRTVLESLGSAGVAAGASGAVSATGSPVDGSSPGTQRRGSSDRGGWTEHAQKLTKDAAMTRREYESFVVDMVEKYGYENARSLTPERVDPETSTIQDDGEVGITSSPDNKQNLNWITAWDHSYEVHGGTPERHLLDTTHALTLYEATETDSQGRNIYFYWHWSQTDSNNGWWHQPGETDFIRNHLDLTNDALVLTSWSPETAADVNGEYVQVGVSFGVKGVTVGAQSEVYVKDGEIGPETNNHDPGKSGEFSVTLDGHDVTGRNNVNGTSVVRTYWNQDKFYSCEWSTKVRGEV